MKKGRGRKGRVVKVDKRGNMGGGRGGGNSDLRAYFVVFKIFFPLYFYFLLTYFVFLSTLFLFCLFFFFLFVLFLLKKKRETFHFFLTSPARLTSEIPRHKGSRVHFLIMARGFRYGEVVSEVLQLNLLV